MCPGVPQGVCRGSAAGGPQQGVRSRGCAAGGAQQGARSRGSVGGPQQGVRSRGSAAGDPQQGVRRGSAGCAQGVLTAFALLQILDRLPVDECAATFGHSLTA
eukprot:1194195-Prorocentrum_minimum.AAC.4